MPHDNQIEFSRKIDRTTQEYHFKVPGKYQISKDKEAKKGCSLNSIFYDG